MLPFNWSLVMDRLLRYYFPALLLIPVLLTLILTGKQSVRINRKPFLLITSILVLMIAADVVEYWLATLTVYSVWRVVVSVIGYCARPSCLLILLLDMVPAAKRTKRIDVLLSLPAIVNSALFCTAFFSPIAFSYTAANDFTRGPLYFVVVAVSALYMLLLLVFAHFNLQRRQRHKSITILLITITGFIAAVLEMNGFVYPAPLLNQTITIGTVLYYLVQYMMNSSEVIENMTLSLLLMQIRPHFINNSLAAIRGMIRKDPDKAAEALNHFSGYLQDSMHSILQTNLIPFSQEMGLIDNYLYMEQTRFRDSITIHKELIDEDFPVPPLTVQPLVENAVRHGLRGIQAPGQLTIRTQKDGKEYRIIIADNGCGFDPTQPPDNKRPHVGLRNVRERLDLMCSGTLEIQSSSAGTTATIHIPVKALDSARSAGE